MAENLIFSGAGRPPRSYGASFQLSSKTREGGCEARRIRSYKKVTKTGQAPPACAIAGHYSGHNMTMPDEVLVGEKRFDSGEVAVLAVVGSDGQWLLGFRANRRSWRPGEPRRQGNQSDYYHRRNRVHLSC